MSLRFRRRLVVVGCVFAAYVIAQQLLYPEIGRDVIALSAAPIVAGCVLFGLRGGLFVYAIVLAVNVALFAGVGIMVRAAGIRVVVGLVLTIAIGLIVDLTRRLRAIGAQLEDEVLVQKRALARSEANFRQIVEGARDMVWVHRDGVVVYVNPALVATIGCPARDLVDRPMLDFIVADDRAAASRRVVAVVDEGNPTQPLEIRISRRDGTTVIVEESDVVIEYDGSPAVLVFARDVSERKAFETIAAAADRMALVGTLAGGIVHALNNPLAVVVPNLEYLLRSGPTPPPDFVEVITDCHNATTRMRAIVRDIRMFTRVAEGSPGPVDVRAVVDSTLMLIAGKMLDSVIVETRFEDAPPIDGDKAKLGHVVMNLIVNALQALPTRPGKDNRITISVRPVRDQVVLEVEDNGDGIPPEMRDRMFEPYSTTKPAGTGTGFGLWVCRNLVHSMGGTIELCSAVGEPTRFCVTLSASTAARVTGQVTRSRVLVAENEPPVGRTIAASSRPSTE